MHRLIIIALLSLLPALLPLLTAAQTTQPAPATEPAEAQQPIKPQPQQVPEYLKPMIKLEQERYIKSLNAEVARHFAKKDYAGALRVLDALRSHQPDNPDIFYNMACALALGGDKEQAIRAIELAALNGYHHYQQLRNDGDLDSLRDDERFKDVAEKVLKNERELLPPYEKGLVISSAHMVEMWPAGGLNVRVRFSKHATPENKHRLVIWMHPGGGSLNDVFESITTTFTRRGFATLVPTQKSWRGWSNRDAEALLVHTLPQVQRIEGIDVARPVLMGYDAGAQKALELWAANPAAYGGIIVSGGYPIDVAHYRETKELKTIDVGDGADKTPVLAIIGELDQRGMGAKVWRKAEQKLKAKGVPLTVVYSKGRAHEWLADDEQDALRAWLEQVAQGKVPGAPVAKTDDASSSDETEADTETPSAAAD